MTVPSVVLDDPKSRPQIDMIVPKKERPSTQFTVRDPALFLGEHDVGQPLKLQVDWPGESPAPPHADIKARPASATMDIVMPARQNYSIQGLHDMKRQQRTLAK